MKRFNKFLALFLAVVMIVGLMPAISAAAADSDVALFESFEDWTDITAPHTVWKANGNPSVTVSDEKALDGSKSIKFSTPNQDEHHRAKLNYVVPAAVIDKMEDGAEYTFTAYYYSDGAQYKGNWEFKNVASGWASGDFALTDGQWTKLEHTFTLNKSALPNGRLTLVMGMAWNSAEKSVCDMYIDSVSLVKKYDYSSVLKELNAKDSIAMAGDVDGTGNDLVLKAGKTLDLAGYTLTVDSLSAMPGAKVIDSVGTGKIVVANDNLTLQADNGMIPIKTNAGYVLSNVKLTNNELEDDGLDDIMVYETRPSLGAANNAAYLVDGAADNGLSIIIRLTWTNESNGTTTIMDVPCSDEVIKDIYAAGSSQAIRLLVKGVDSVENLKVATVVTSTTGVTCVSDFCDYVAPVA